MRINQITSQAINTQNFNGKILNNLADNIAKNPKLLGAIGVLAGSSVIAQKVVTSGAEATIGPIMDITVGKAITKIANEKDGKTNQNSKVQAVRTTSQAIGGTITGIIIRGACIAASTALLASAGKKVGSKLAEELTCYTDKNNKVVKINPENIYQYKEHMEKWGKNVGGAVALLIMTFTNFVIDAPFINWINKNLTNIIHKISQNKSKGGVNEQNS